MLRNAWGDINDTRRRSYAGNQSYKLGPRNDFDNPRLLSPKEEQKVRTGRQRAKEKAKADDIPGNSNNHSSSAPRAVRVAEKFRGGLNPEKHPKSLNERSPHQSSEWGDTKRSNPSTSVPHTQSESNSCST